MSCRPHECWFSTGPVILLLTPKACEQEVEKLLREAIVRRMLKWLF